MNEVYSDSAGPPAANYARPSAEIGVCHQYGHSPGFRGGVSDLHRGPAKMLVRASRTPRATAGNLAAGLGHEQVPVAGGRARCGSMSATKRLPRRTSWQPRAGCRFPRRLRCPSGQ